MSSFWIIAFFVFYYLLLWAVVSIVRDLRRRVDTLERRLRTLETRHEWLSRSISASMSLSPSPTQSPSAEIAASIATFERDNPDFLIPEVKEPLKKAHTCAFCKARIPPEASNCPNCGAPIGD